MPLNAEWLVEDGPEGAPVDRWLGGLKALHVEGAQIVNRLRAGALEDGTALTAGQTEKLRDWFDGYVARLQSHVTTPPGQLSD